MPPLAIEDSPLAIEDSDVWAGATAAHVLAFAAVSLPSLQGGVLLVLISVSVFSPVVHTR